MMKRRKRRGSEVASRNPHKIIYWLYASGWPAEGAILDLVRRFPHNDRYLQWRSRFRTMQTASTLFFLSRSRVCSHDLWQAQSIRSFTDSQQQAHQVIKRAFGTMRVARLRYAQNCLAGVAWEHDVNK